MNANRLWEHDPILTNKVDRIGELLANEMSMRSDFFKKFLDPRRNIDDECGYPKVTSYAAEQWQDLYEREPIANRIVQLMPKECWQRNPTVYETEDAEDVTDFEEGWDNFNKKLGGSSFHQDEKGGAVWAECKKADVLSRIGGFGLLLIGFDDGLPLSSPVEGMVTVNATFADGRVTINGTTPLVADSPPTEQEIEHLVANKIITKASDLGVIQPTSMQFGPSETVSEEPSKKERNVLFLQAFSENLVQVVRFEFNPNNPRFGQPIMYRVTLSDPREPHAGIGLPMATVFVHWTRVIHLADIEANASNSKVFAPPVLRPVLNSVLDIKKVRGASAEAYWKNCLASLSLETHPQLGGDVDVDKTALRSMLEQRNNGLQRDIVTTGMSAKTLAPQAVDPTPYIAVQMEAIAIQLGCPLRVLKGSERGELASTQDDSNWDDRVMGRCTGYVTPRIIVPLVDRLIMAGALPVPEGYTVEWPDFESLSKKDKVTIASAQTTAMTAYIQGDGQSLVQPQDYLTSVLGFKDEEVEAWLAASAKVAEEHAADQQAVADEQGFQQAPPEGFQHPPEPPQEPPAMNAWTDEAREAAALSRQAGRMTKLAKDKDSHGLAGDAHSFAAMAQSKMAKSAFKDARNLAGQGHRASAQHHVKQAESHYSHVGPRATREVAWKYAVNELATLNAFCPTGPGGGIDSSCGAAEAHATADHHAKEARRAAKEGDREGAAAHGEAANAAREVAKKHEEIARVKEEHQAGIDQQMKKAADASSKVADLEKVVAAARQKEAAAKEKVARLKATRNAFCPTGPGGGLDNSCGGAGGGGGASAAEHSIKAEPKTAPPPGPHYEPNVEHDGNGNGVTDAARIGVPGMSVPPPPAIGRMPNLTPRERRVETDFISHFSKDPDGVADQFRQVVAATTKPGEPKTFGTDDAKVLNGEWMHPDLATRAQNRATLNTPLHQTANAIAKRGFLRELDTLKPGDNILVTVGGCGAGKGYALKNVPEALAAKGAAKVVWDSAGDQNATENPWIHQEAAKRGLSVTYLHVHADPATQWAHPAKGVVSRAEDPKDGRMVDAKVFADSYVLGARNHAAFYEAHKNEPSSKFLFLDNVDKPRLTDSSNLAKVAAMSRSKLAADSQKIVADGNSSPHVKRGALMGERIWTN